MGCARCIKVLNSNAKKNTVSQSVTENCAPKYIELEKCNDVLNKTWPNNSIIIIPIIDFSINGLCTENHPLSQRTST